jgi:hypothetical protein
LSLDEATPLEGLDHVIDRGGREQEVPLDVRFGRGNTKPKGIPGDELEILALASGGLNTLRATLARWLARPEGGSQALSTPLDEEH